MDRYVAENFQMGRVIIKGASAPNGGKVQVIGIKRAI